LWEEGPTKHCTGPNRTGRPVRSGAVNHNSNLNPNSNHISNLVPNPNHNLKPNPKLNHNLNPNRPSGAVRWGVSSDRLWQPQ